MIAISLRKVIRRLCFVVLGFCFTNITVQVAKYFWGRGGLWGFYRLLNLDDEANIPSWYSSVALLLCALLLMLIALLKKEQGDRYITHWRGLSAIFLFLSLDEAASLHEMLIEPLQALTSASGFFLLAWVIPGIAFVGVVGLMYSKFLLSLPAQTRHLFLLAATLYVMGSLGFEMIGSYFLDSKGASISYDANSGWDGITYPLIIAVEELLEMLGIVTFIYALLAYISSSFKEVRIAFLKE